MYSITKYLMSVTCECGEYCIEEYNGVFVCNACNNVYAIFKMEE